MRMGARRPEQYEMTRTSREIDEDGTSTPQREARHGLSDPGSSRGKQRPALNKIAPRRHAQREARPASEARREAPGKAAPINQKARFSGRQDLVILSAAAEGRAVEGPLLPPTCLLQIKTPARGRRLKTQLSYPFTCTFENDSTAVPEVGCPKVVAGLNVVKMSMFFISGVRSFAWSGAESTL